MKALPQARRHADDLLVYDNTPNGRGHRLVARFIAGELVKVTHSSPEWLKDVFGHELRAEGKQQERPARRRLAAGSCFTQNALISFDLTARESSRLAADLIG